MTDALFAVQTAIVAALSASTDLQNLLGNPPRLYDHVPPGAVFPYVTCGPTHVLPHDDLVETGFAQIVALDIWSHYRGGKEARDIFAALYAALHRASLFVAGQIFLDCEFHSADLALDTDGLTTRITARFSVTVQSS